jgi:RNA polymerase sigma factor (sigma-70 family)
MPAEDARIAQARPVPKIVADRGEFGTALWEATRRIGRGIKCRLRRKCPSLSMEDVEDAISAALCNLWENSDRYKDSPCVEALLYRATVNAAIDILKQKLRLPSTPLVGFERLDDQEDVRQFQMGTRLKKLIEVLKSLSDEERCIILHWANNGLAENGGRNEAWTTALAAELDTSPSSLRVRRLRILNKIQHLLSEHGHDDLSKVEA